MAAEGEAVRARLSGQRGRPAVGVLRRPSRVFAAEGQTRWPEVFPAGRRQAGGRSSQPRGRPGDGRKSVGVSLIMISVEKYRESTNTTTQS